MGRKRQPPPWIVSDELWARIEPLLPVVHRRYRYPGRKRMDDRKALCGILFVLQTGIAWEYLPQELGFGSGTGVLAAAAGLERRRRVASAARSSAGRIACSRSDRLVPGGDRQLARPGAARRPKTGPSPVDRGRPGSKHHLICDGSGIPLAVTLTGGHRNDVTQILALLAEIPPIRGKVGRPWRRPPVVYADRGYDHDKYRRLLRKKGIRPMIARRGTPHGSGLGVYRWVVEQTLALLRWFGRLRIRWERRDDIHEAFLMLACDIICRRRLQRTLR